MAVGTPTLATPVVGATASSVTTASFTPSANVLLVAFIQGRGSGVTGATIADSLGGTWTSAGLGGQDANVVSGVHYQVVGGSPAAMTVTVTGVGTTSQACCAIVSLTGAGTDFSNAAVVSGATSSVSNSIPSATASDSVGLAFLTKNSTGTISTAPSGYTSLTNSLPATNIRLAIHYDVGSPGQTQNYTTSNATSFVQQAIEIKVPSAGAVTGTVAQTLSHAVSEASGAFLTVSAFQPSAFQTSPAFQMLPAVAGSFTGTIAQVLGHATHAADGTVTAPGVTGTVAQTLSPAQQAATGTSTAPAVTGTVAQTLGHATQEAVGLVITPITGTIVQTVGKASQAADGLFVPAGASVIVQTAGRASQAAEGTVSGAVVPDTRPIGGFAGWSEAEEAAHRRYRRIKRKAEVELREMLEAAAEGRPWPPEPVKQVVEALRLEAVALMPEISPEILGDLRAQVQLLEQMLRQMQEEEELRLQIEAARLAEEELLVLLMVA